MTPDERDKSLRDLATTELTDDDYLDALEDLWPTCPDEWRDERLLALARRACEAFPESPDILWLAAELLEGARFHRMWSHPQHELSAINADIQLAFEWVKRLVRIDPAHAEAWARLGFWHDVAEEYAEAEDALRRAIQLGDADPSTYALLARVVSQLGRRGEALRILSEAECPHWEDPAVREMRRAIVDHGWEPSD